MRYDHWTCRWTMESGVKVTGRLVWAISGRTTVCAIAARARELGPLDANAPAFVRGVRR